MSAYLNLLREEASREELLREIQKKMDRISKLEAECANLRVIAKPVLASRCPLEELHYVPQPNGWVARLRAAAKLFFMRLKDGGDPYAELGAHFIERDNQVWELHFALVGAKAGGLDALAGKTLSLRDMIFKVKGMRAENWAYKQRIKSALDAFKVYRFYLMNAAQKDKVIITHPTYVEDAQRELQALDALMEIWGKEFAA